jgi:hypothetical protein
MVNIGFIKFRCSVYIIYVYVYIYVGWQRSLGDSDGAMQAGIHRKGQSTAHSIRPLSHAPAPSLFLSCPRLYCYYFKILWI